MARASRSKRQPEFDPSELNDLIFSPAVGSGVGSHLVSGTPKFLGYHEEPQPTECRTPIANLTTVDMSDMSTVVRSQESTSSNELSSELLALHPLKLLQQEGATRADLSTVDVIPSQDTIAESVLSAKHSILWITEQGDLVPQARVKRIRLAQDVINSAEESVYDTLWTKTSQSDHQGSFRVAQAGYDYLVKKTRLSKKTIQRIIAKLIDKDFISIERPADIYQRTSTIYRVFSYKAVLERHIQKERSHVAKMGPGFSYVRPMADPRSVAGQPQLEQRERQEPAHLSTVDKSNMSTMDISRMSSVVKVTTETVGALDPSTVVRQTTSSIGNEILVSTTSSTTIREALGQYGTADDDVVNRLIKSCKTQSPDCTEEEIVHFIREKGLLVRVKDSRIYSPIGFLLTAVPKCLSGEAFRLYRKEEKMRQDAQAAYEAKRQAELDEWRKEQEQQLASPTVSEEDKRFIRECLGISIKQTADESCQVSEVSGTDGSVFRKKT